MSEGKEKEFEKMSREKSGPHAKEAEFSRREFLKTAGTGLFAALALGNTNEALAMVEKAAGAKEQKTGEPKISFDIFYSAHVTREDAKGLAERFRKADMYISEAFGWTEAWRDDMNAVSRGAMTPEMFFRKRDYDPEYASFLFEAAETEMLYGSKKPVAVIDLPQNHPLHLKLLGAEEEIGRFYPTRSFREILQKFTSDTKRIADLQLERERYMFQELRRLAAEIRKGNVSELKGRGNVKILLFLGAIHTGIYHELKKSGAEAERGFRVMPYIFGEFAYEMLRRQMFGKPVDNELAARALGGIFLLLLARNYGGYLSREHHKRALFERRVISRFSFDDIRSVFEKAQKSDDPIGSLLSGFSEKLDEKKIRIPSDEKEFDEFLKK